MLEKIKNLFRRKPKQQSEQKPRQDVLKEKMSSIKVREALALIRAHGNKDPRMKILERFYELSGAKIKKPKLFPGVVPTDARSDEVYLATDAAITDVCAYAAEVCKCNGFPGYSFLSELTQYSEYRSPSETTSKEMVRKWITVTSTGTDEQSSEKVKQINDALVKFNVKELFEKSAMNDGLFGNSFLFINLDYQSAENKWEQTPLVLDTETVKKGMLKGFTVIEPIWVSPYEYNSIDPTREDFYKPNTWYVLSKRIHASRMLQFVSREVPDLLKPAYNFGGISMTQLIIHYVEAWYRTRNSINDLISSFSISGIKTDLSSYLQDGGSHNIEDLVHRAALFNEMRDNQGLMVMDMAGEEFFQFNVPLSGLDKLQAQSQEQMAAPTHTPLVKLNGITPTGLNANSDGEIKVYYDYISSMQETLFRNNLKIVLDVLQLNEFGEIDPSISFVFNPLEESTDLEKSQVRKTDAETDAILVTGGVIAVEESRKRIANDKNSNYGGLDVDKLPPPPPNMYETGQNYGEENTTF